MHEVGFFYTITVRISTDLQFHDVSEAISPGTLLMVNIKSDYNTIRLITIKPDSERIP